MHPYKTKLEIISIDGKSLRITSLADKHQFYDPNKEAEKLGITDSMWPISGLVWPSGLVLANVISQLDLANLKVLEVGCGIGIASLIAAKNDVDITASDYHPIVKSLLFKNAKDNNIDNIKYTHANWNHPISNLGKFDLIIGSDLLYEVGLAEILSIYIDCHLGLGGQVILIDPGRRASGKIRHSMEAVGFQYQTVKLDAAGNMKRSGRFTQYTFKK